MKDEGDNTLPSLRSFDRNCAENEIRFYQTLFMLHDRGIESCVPAIITKIIPDERKVEVLPLPKFVKDTKSGDATFDRDKVIVPIFSICHGGFQIELPVCVGDTGYLFACDRNCKDVIKENSGIVTKDQEENKPINKGSGKPSDNGYCKFTYGFFIPFSWNASGYENKGEIVIKYLGNGNEEEARTIYFGKDGLRYKGKTEDVSVMTDMRYTKETHQVQKKTRILKFAGDFVVGKEKESDWSMIDGGQAEPIED